MSTTKLGDDFLRIPKLDATGANWVVYRDRFLISIEARGLGDHLDGSAPMPTNPHPDPPAAAAAAEGSSPAAAPALSATQLAAVEEYRKALKLWKQEEAIVKQQIAATIPDSLFLKIRSLPTVELIWTMLQDNFQNKSRMVSLDLKRRLQEERCGEKGDIRAHFAKLRLMREDLASMGYAPDDLEFYTILMGSLPASYDSFISVIDASHSTAVAAQYAANPNYIPLPPSPENFIQSVTDEYERRLLRSKSSGKKDAENVAFYSNDSEKSQKGSSGRRKDIECFNCKKKGHFKSDCWAKGGGKEGQGEHQKGKGKDRRKGKGKAKEKSEDKEKEASTSAAKAAADDSDSPVEAWMASIIDDDSDFDTASSFSSSPSTDFDFTRDLFEPVSETDYWSSDSGEDSDMPSLQSVSDSEREDDDDDHEFYESESESPAPNVDEVPDHLNPFISAPAFIPNEPILGDDEDTCEEECGEDEDVDKEEEYYVGDAHFIPIVDEAYTTTKSIEELTSPTDVDLYDSGATRHMSGARHRFINYVEIPEKPISAADNRTFSAIGKGDMYILIPNGPGGESRVLLKDVLYAPSMTVTLVSISRIALSGSTLVFHGEHCRIYDKNRRLLGKIVVKGGLYRVYAARPEGESAGKVEEMLTIDELHRRLGHVSHERARRLVEKKMVTGILLDPDSEPTVCESCEWAKGERKAIRRQREEERSKAVGDEIHSDLWGPAPVETINRKKFYISFTDDFSRYTHLFFLRSKDEAFDAYLAYEAYLRVHKGVPIKALRSDRGGEYLSDEFSDHLRLSGTIRHLTVHDTPEYNGVSERLNRTILAKVRAMLHESGLPNFLWGEACRHAAFLKNCTWTRSLKGQTPHEVFHGTKPNLSDIHPWGCRVRVHDDDNNKLGARSKIGRWMGFDEESNAHRIYWAEKRSITVERSVKFNFEDEIFVEAAPLEGEKEPFVAWTPPDEPSTSKRATVEDVDDEPSESKAPTDHVENRFRDEPIEDLEPQGPRRSSRIRKESDYVKRLRDGVGVMSNRATDPLLPKGIQEGSEMGGMADEEEDAWEVVEVAEYAMAAVMDGAEGLTPTFEEARKRADWPKWDAAIKEELASLKANGTFELVERPPNTNVTKCRWVLRIKKNAAGEIDKYKARLVAKGFTQIHGVDYYETYAPVARFASFRLLLALAARNGWTADIIDFDSAYLNSRLGPNEQVYLEQPPSYATRDSRVWVWRLHKTLYGLKQGAKNWYDALCKALTDLGFVRTDADHGVFVKKEGSLTMIIIAVHVDDCLLVGNSAKAIAEFKKNMNKIFKLTDLGPVNWLLGIKVTRDLTNRTISLSQHAYIESIITRFNFNDLKPSSIPMDPNAPLSKSQSPSKMSDVAKMQQIPFREAVGSLMYAAMGTRPDIAFAVSTVAQYSENPGWAHWEAVKRIFRYLLGTQKLELVYGGEKRGVEGYVDADGASQEHRRAISGYVFLVDGGAVSWSSKKQELVTLSTTEAEYVAQTHAAKEAIWLRRLVEQLFGPAEGPTILFSDSKSAIALAKDGHYHARTKHIDIRYHFIRYIIEKGTIKLIYCPTNDMTADILTKALPSVKAKHFASALGLSTV